MKCAVINSRTGEKVGTFGSLKSAYKECDQLNKEYGGRGGWFDVQPQAKKKTSKKDKLKIKA